MTLFGNIDAGVLRAMVGELPAKLRAKPCPVGDVPCRRATMDERNKQLTERFGLAGDVEISDARIPRPDGSQLRLRIYRKAHSTEGGAILYVRGGGMILSSAEHYDARCMHYCTNTGIPVVAVDYPLAPEHPYPAQLDDIDTTLQWMLDTAGSSGWSADRIGMVGDSAGGGLVAGFTLRNRDRSGPALACQMLVYPMLDDRNTIPDPRFPRPFQIWSFEDNETGWGAYLSGLPAGDEVPIYAAPARATDLSGLPPTYIDTGTLDIFYDEDLSFGKRLVAAGIPVDGHVWNGAPHGFDYFAHASAIARRAWQCRFDFLRTYLHEYLHG